jgi:peptide-methionine (S)-S-oxide reductase
MIGRIGLVALLLAAAPAPAKALETATLGGGCFWCLEAAFEELRGVESVVSGYAGGQVAKPSYEAVCGGKTGHAEVVQITFDKRQIGYGDLMRAFFVVHDPTTKDRQGNDVGSQYRSIILTTNPGQEKVAKAVMAELAPKFGKPLTTQVEALTTFWPAEAYHQDYFAKHPDQPYCAFVVAPKVEKLRHAFVDKLKR